MGEIKVRDCDKIDDVEFIPFSKEGLKWTERDKLGLNIRSLSETFTNSERKNRRPDRLNIEKILVADSKLSDAIRNLTFKFSSYETATEADRYQLEWLKTHVNNLPVRMKYFMEDGVLELDKVIESTENILANISQLKSRFRFLSKATAFGNLMFWISDACCSELVLRYTGHPKIFLAASTLAGTISLSGNFFVLKYAIQCIEDLSRLIHKNRDDLKQLKCILQPSLSIDKAISNLFPYEIDKTILSELLLDKANFESERCRRRALYYLILMSNVKHNRTLLEDEEFLMSVKFFVENPVSQAWWIRLKIQQLMESLEISGSSIQQLFMSTDVFHRRLSFILFPLVGSVFLSMKNERIRFLVSCVGTVASGLKLVGSTDRAFHSLTEIEKELEGDHFKLRKMLTVFNTEFD